MTSASERHVLRSLSERYPWCAATVAASMGPNIGMIMQTDEVVRHLTSLQARGHASAFNETKPTRWLRTAAGADAIRADGDA